MSATELPADLTRLDFRLIQRPDATMFAVSQSHGCSLRSADLAVVIRTARTIASFTEWVDRQKKGTINE